LPRRGDVDGAVTSLDAPLGSIYFPALDEATSTNQVVDSFEFYGAAGGRTELLDCVFDRMEPPSVVTCQVDQQVDALIPIGLEFSSFSMVLEVWDAETSRIGRDSLRKPTFDHVVGSSRCFDFYNRHIKPNGPAQGSGAPARSKENGQRIAEQQRRRLLRNLSVRLSASPGIRDITSCPRRRGGIPANRGSVLGLGMLARSCTSVSRGRTRPLSSGDDDCANDNPS
jgi:hypothetical protein